MKRKILNLDESLFDEPIIEREAPIAQKINGLRQTEQNERETRYLESVTPKISENSQINEVKVIDNLSRGIRANTDDNVGCSMSSEFEYKSKSKMYKCPPENNKQAMSSLLIGNDSNLTIKTKKSSKFSIFPQNSAEKMGNSDHKGVPSIYEANKRESMFKVENKHANNTFTMKKVTTPQSTQNNAKKRTFKFDLGILSSNNKNNKAKITHPHSCKNAQTPFIFEVIDHEKAKMQNATGIKNDVELYSKPAIGLKSLKPEILHSTATLSKRSDKSEKDSVHIGEVAKIVQSYEKKIERLMQDQKFKIANYKRMLEEKDTMLVANKRALEQLKQKYSELEESLTNQTKICEDYHKPASQTNFKYKCRDSTNENKINPDNTQKGPKSIEKPVPKSILKQNERAKDKPDIPKNKKPVDSRVEGNMNGNHRYVQTPVNKGQSATAFHDPKKNYDSNDNKRVNNVLFLSGNLKFSPHKARKTVEEVNEISRSRIRGLCSPITKNYKGAGKTNTINGNSSKATIKNQKKMANCIKMDKKNIEEPTATGIKRNHAVVNNTNNSITNFKKENVGKSSFVSKLTKSNRTNKKNSDLSSGKIDIGLEIANEIQMAFKKGARTYKPVFRSNIIRLP